jgi:hypothetical protein
MKNRRVLYVLVIIVVILVGIVSRQLQFIPLCIGDGLYAVMVYFGLRFLMIDVKYQTTAIVALSYCYIIECLQLYRAEWLVSLRNTTLGHYVLGQGFSWGDIVAYSVGVGIAVLIDYLSVVKWNTHSNLNTNNHRS